MWVGPGGSLEARTSDIVCIKRELLRNPRFNPPPPVAPHAVRRETDDRRHVLARSAAGDGPRGTRDRIRGTPEARENNGIRPAFGPLERVVRSADGLCFGRPEPIGLRRVPILRGHVSKRDDAGDRGRVAPVDKVIFDEVRGLS